MTDFYQILTTMFSNDILKSVIVFLVLPLVISYFEGKFLSDVAQKKNVWNNFIREKGSIKDCFERYEKIQRDSQCGFLLYYLILVVSATLVFIIIFLSLIVSSYLFNQIQSYTYLETLRTKKNVTYDFLFLVVISFLFLLSSLVPFLLSIKLKNYVLITDNEVIHKYAKVNHIYSIIILYSLVFLFYFVNILFNFNEFFNIIIICAIILFLISIYFSTLNRKDYTQRVKDNVNNSYSRSFPYLEISTLGGKDVFGKLENVFDSESIVLNNKEEYTTILWSSISTLKEQSRNDFDGQKKLTDFFINFN